MANALQTETEANPSDELRLDGWRLPVLEAVEPKSMTLQGKIQVLCQVRLRDSDGAVSVRTVAVNFPEGAAALLAEACSAGRLRVRELLEGAAVDYLASIGALRLLRLDNDPQRRLSHVPLATLRTTIAEHCSGGPLQKLWNEPGATAH